MSNRTDLPSNHQDNADNMTENPNNLTDNTDLSSVENAVEGTDSASDENNAELDSADLNGADLNSADLNSAEPNNDTAIEAFFAPSGHTRVDEDFKAGYVAIVGRPNVGKSTLMNHLLGQKLSITSRKPQTTRHRIHGILSNDEMQAVFVDTPGIHRNEVRAINERMNKAAVSALVDVDLVLFVVDSDQWRDDDLLVLQKLGDTELTVVLVINKADTLKDKGSILPLIETFSDSFDFADIVPVSALKSQNLDRLQEVIASHLPKAAPIYDTEQITDRSERFLASEIIREKIMRSAGDEVPYDLTVQIDEFKDEAAHMDPKTGRPRKACTFIDATIFVERSGQKAIVIGEKGQRIKQVGIDSRKDMEQLFDKKVMLTLWVKVKRGWSDDERALTSLGY
ncbi:GTPase Era [Psychrobacter sp. LV10R520-6]|uniref:GTPase Era n=1 Tax=Psychrobacter sp. LV10R520-6 TaxID=1415574 RepID=UPI0024C51736|nr:GTPase Era [Psychrobacter sp. LV10R520-6]SNT68982.1 GTP-binding protein Era [Psychrobacter sp. LV10R520-6]